jgi:hypothetical protein
MLKRAALIVVFAGFVMQSAVAEDWPRTPDGWAEIAIKSAKFHLPTASDLKNIRFNEFAKARKMTLQQVLSSPDAAAADFKDHPDVVFTMYVGLDPAGSFLGKFRNSELRSFAFSFDIGQNQGNCEAWNADIERAKQAGQFSDDLDDGWSRAFNPRTKRTLYLRPPASIGNRTQFQALYCDVLGTCGAAICLSKEVSFNFAYLNRDLPSSTRSVVVQKAEEVLKTVLIDAGSKE